MTSDQQLQDAYRDLLRQRPRDRAACPAPEAVVALIEQRGSDADRLATLDHVMSCAGCKADFDLMRTVAGRKAGPGRRGRWPLAAAAVVALSVSGSLVFMELRARSAGQDIERGGADEVELVSPRGNTATRPVTFTWRKATGPARYSLEVFNPAGDAVYGVDVTDTSVVLPATVLLQVGTTYHWWVLIRTADGSEVRTAPVSFTP
jgi:hypothetical protein